MKKPPLKPYTDPRQKQETPAAVVAELLEMIRTQFYGDANGHTWGRDQHYIRREVVLWPASWLSKRGVALPLAKYRSLLVEKLVDVKRHCATAEFTYFPAYLAACVQSHFKHHEDEIYEAAKTIRGPLDSVLGKLPAAVSAPTSEPLAEAHAVLAGRQRAQRRPGKAAREQLEML